MKDRFDLESEITQIYSFSDHLRMIANAIVEQARDVDSLANSIEGIASLLELQAEKLTDTMEQCFNLNDYAKF